MQQVCEHRREFDPPTFSCLAAKEDFFKWRRGIFTSRLEQNFFKQGLSGPLVWLHQCMHMQHVGHAVGGAVSVPAVPDDRLAVSG